jgi:hypothetical protein
VRRFTLYLPPCVFPLFVFFAASSSPPSLMWHRFKSSARAVGPVPAVLRPGARSPNLFVPSEYYRLILNPATVGSGTQNPLVLLSIHQCVLSRYQPSSPSTKVAVRQAPGLYPICQQLESVRLRHNCRFDLRRWQPVQTQLSICFRPALIAVSELFAFALRALVNTPAAFPLPLCGRICSQVDSLSN